MYKKIFDSKNATREEWLKVRKLGLGGSDMSAVLGVNQWRSPLDVWLDKTSDTVEEKESEPDVLGYYPRGYCGPRIRKAHRL